MIVDKQKNRIKRIRLLLVVFMICLFLSGLTAIPVRLQLEFGLSLLAEGTSLHHFLSGILAGYMDMAERYPFLLYGYDWLAFAHFVLAILFIGPYKDPVRNTWVIEFGLIACVLVLPYAFIAGHFRGLPLWWRLCDCSFGVVGFVLLWQIRKQVQLLPQQITPSYALH